jgi:hypothetical protein
MRIPSRTTVGILLTTFSLLAMAQLAHAQTGARLLLDPLLSEKEFLEARADALFFNQGATDNNDDFKMSLYRTSGRIREQRENFVPRLGWDFNLYHFDTSANLPEDLLDTSAAIGLELPTMSGWRGGLTVGLGYAGDKPFAQGDAWYGKATAVFGKDINKYTTVALVLDYDGSRAYFPDIPLPGFAIRHQFDPTLSYTLGVPVTSIRWNPIDPFKIELTYIFFDIFEASADYEIIPHLVLFGKLESDRRGFHVEQIQGNDRLLFEQRRVELGVRFQPIEETTFTAALGYAWGGEFSRGWDFRESDHIADISDEPYFRIAFETRF